jgi:hypothetical protein
MAMAAVVVRIAMTTIASGSFTAIFMFLRRESACI